MRVGYIISVMDEHCKKKNRRDRRPGRIFKRIRIPLFTVAGILLTAFIIIPLDFRLNEIPAGDASVAVAAQRETAAPEASPSDAEPMFAALFADETEALPSPGLTPAAAEPAESYTLLTSGDTSEQVRNIQQRLMELLYMESDETTDYFGEATVAALRRFQRTHHLNETGEADEITQRILFSEGATPYIIIEGYSGNDVLTLQSRLDELGYYAGKLNGYFGAATYKALSAFQTKNSMVSSGEADYLTRELIYSPSALPAIDPTPTPTPTATPKPTPTPRITATSKPTATPKPAAGTATPGGSEGTGWGEQLESTAVPIVTAEPTATQAAQYTADPIVSNGNVEDFIDVAMNQLGKPYIYSTEGPDSFDCSGLVYYCLRSVGISISRYSSSGLSQVSSWETVNGKGNLRRGDLIFYKTNGSSSDKVTHVAIWLGGNSLIHASASAGKICTTTWSTWSDDNFLFAKRVFD